MVQESNPVQLKLAEFTSNDFEVNIDVYFTGSSTPKQMTLQVRESTGNIDSRSECGTWSGSKTCGTLVNGTNYRTNPSGALSNNVWYTFKVVRQNNNITCKILNGTSSVVEKTSVGWTDNPVLTFIQFSGYIGTLRWKNLKVTKL